MFIPAAPTLELKTLLAQARADSPPWPEADHVIPTASGRAGLYQALRAWDVHAGVALLPAYLCTSVVTPIQHAGLTPRFYRVDRHLRIDPDDLARRLTGDVRVVVIIHYLGFPQPDLPAIAELCRVHGAYLIEDCAHALFSRPADPPLGRAGDAAVYSLPKSLPVPDGGILVLHTEPRNPVFELTDSGNAWHGASQRGLAIPLGNEKPGFSKRVRWLVRAAKLFMYALEFQLGISPRPVLLRMRGLRRRIQAAGDTALTNLDGTWSPLTRHIVERTSSTPIVEARRANYRYLLERFPVSARARPLFDDMCASLNAGLPEGVCPLGFPLLVAERDAVRHRLYRAGVATRTYWDALPVHVPTEQFPDAAYLRDHILILPVHQSLREEHLEWMLGVVREE